MDELPKKSYLSSLFDTPKRLTHSGRVGYRIIQFSCFLFCSMFLMAHFYIKTSQNSDNFIVLACVPIFAVGSVLVLLSFRKVKKFAQLHNYELCLNCICALDKLPEDGNCPECDDTYNHVELRKFWKPSKQFRRAKRRFKRSEHYMWMGWPIAMLLGLGLTLPNVPMSVSRYWLMVFLLPPIAGAIGLIVSFRDQRTAKRHDFLVCPECMYQIAQDKNIQVCPECGAKFYTIEVIDYWQSWGKAKTPNFNHLGPDDDD